MKSNEQSIFIHNLQYQDAYSFNDPLLDINERIPLDKREVWIDRSLIPTVPPAPAAFPGGDISGPVRGISGVLLTSLNDSPRRFKYQGADPQQFINMVPASYFNNAYTPILRDFKGMIVPYNPNIWIADGLLSIVEFRAQSPKELGYAPPFTIDYWQYIGPTASSWNNDGNINLQNLGSGAQIYNTNTQFGLRSITTGSGLTANITSDSEMINLENTLTGNNVGNGVGIFIDKTDNNLNFRSLVSSENIVTFDETSDSIDINISNKSIVLTKLADISANRIIGNNTNDPATPVALTVSEVKNMLGLTTGTITLEGAITGSSNTGTISTSIANNSVSLQNLAELTANTIIGNNTNDPATPVALTADQVKTMLGINFIQNLTFTGDVTLGTLQPNGTIPSTISNGVVSLTKMSTLSGNTLIGNNNSGDSSPAALNSTQVKTLLELDQVANINLNTWNGSTFVNTLGTINTLNVNTLISNSTANSNLTLNANGTGFIDCGSFPLKTNTLSAGTTNSNLTLNANGTGFIDCGSFPLKTNTISAGTTNSNLTLNANGTGVINCGSFPLKTNTISAGTTNSNLTLNANGTGVIDCQSILQVNDEIRSTSNLSIIAGDGTNEITILSPLNMIDNSISNALSINSNTINCDTITSRGVIDNALRLNGFSGGGLKTQDSKILISSTVINTDSELVIDGPTSTNIRQIKCNQNNTSKCSFGLSGTSNFFVKDLNIPSVDLLQLTLGSANRNNALKLPSYTSNGLLRITDGTVTVDTDFVAETISVERIVTPFNGNLTVLCSVNDNSTRIAIDGVTTAVAASRFIEFRQNGIGKMSAGLASNIVANNSNYFVRDLVNSADLLKLMIGGTNRVRFPTYTDGSLSIISNSTDTGILSSTSDRRLKHNEETLNSLESLQKIMNLQPKKYSWKSDTSNKVKIGFIAQDVESEIPEAVDGKKFEYEFIRSSSNDGSSNNGSSNDGSVKLDENGNPVLDYDKPRYRGLDQCAILSTLVSAFQEVNIKVNDLTKQVQDLQMQMQLLYLTNQPTPL
jgi:hypothetical protein